MNLEFNWPSVSEMLETVDRWTYEQTDGGQNHWYTISLSEPKEKVSIADTYVCAMEAAASKSFKIEPS